MGEDLAPGPRVEMFLNPYTETLPSRMWMIRFASCATSSSWVTMMIELPRLWRSRKRSRISRPVWESRLPVGSSARSSDGLFTSARAMATRWRWPPESSFGWWFMRSPRPTAASASSAISRRSRARDLRVDERELDVLQRGGAREQVEGLEDEADLLVADRRQLVVVHRLDRDAVEEVAAGGRAVEAADDVHQRRLAGAGRAHDRDVLAGLDDEVDAAQGVDLLRAELVDAGQLAHLDEVCGIRFRQCAHDWSFFAGFPADDFFSSLVTSTESPSLSFLRMRNGPVTTGSPCRIPLRPRRASRR